MLHFTIENVCPLYFYNKHVTHSFISCPVHKYGRNNFFLYYFLGILLVLYAYWFFNVSMCSKRSFYWTRDQRQWEL